MDTQKKDLLSNANDKPIEESKDNIERIVSKKSIAPLTFLSKNKDMIGLNQNQFRDWLRLHYLAFGGSGHFVPTKEAMKKGYMICDNEYKLKIKPTNDDLVPLVKITITCDGKLTKEGQEFILDLIEKENKENCSNE